MNAWMLRWMYDPESDATPFGGTKAVLLDERGNVRASRQARDEVPHRGGALPRDERGEGGDDMSDDRKVAKTGESVTAKAAAYMRKHWPHLADLLQSKEDFQIKPKSDEKAGQWCCADCGKFFENNMQAQGHPRSHRLAWWTNGHFEEA